MSRSGPFFAFPAALALTAGLTLGACTTVPVTQAYVQVGATPGLRLHVPLSELMYGRVLADPVTLAFAGGGIVSAELLSAEDIGFPLQMDVLPAYLLGMRGTEVFAGLADIQRHELDELRRMLLEELGGSIDSLQFETAEGRGYAGLGGSRSVLFLLVDANPDVIMQVRFSGFAAETVERLFIRSLRK